jgi:hypothetical protein
MPPDFSTVTETCLSLAGLPFHSLPMPPAYALAQAGPPGNRVQCATRRYAIAGRAELRSVLIVSPRVQIINVFAYPRPDYSTPVFASECVQFGAKPIVGVIDLASCPDDPDCRRRAAATLDAAHAAFPQLINADDPPAWFGECRSGHDFFVRPADAAGFEPLFQAHFRLWTEWSAGLVDSMPSSPDSTRCRSRWIQSYKDHHRENSPGLPFLRKTFGENWTEGLLRDHFFA